MVTGLNSRSAFVRVCRGVKSTGLVTQCHTLSSQFDSLKAPAESRLAFHYWAEWINYDLSMGVCVWVYFEQLGRR